MEEKNYFFLIPLTEEQKAAFDKLRKKEGKTSQGILRQIVVNYLKKGLEDGHTDD